MEERIMENTIYGLFQETVNKYRNNVAIIENKRTMTFGELSDMVDILVITMRKTRSCPMAA